MDILHFFLPKGAEMVLMEEPCQSRQPALWVSVFFLMRVSSPVFS